MEYHESKNIINFDTNSIIQPLLSEYISTVTGKKISKNLMDRINMLENLFGSQVR